MTEAEVLTHLAEQMGDTPTRVTDYQAGGALSFDDDDTPNEEPGWNNPLQSLRGL